MKLSKKILAAVLAALMAISMMPFSAITAFAAADLTGNCGANGDNVTYRMQDTNNDGKYDKLTLSGSGAMADYADNYGGNRPWYIQGSTIYYYYLNTINIGDGITYIGENAFRALREVTNVTIPNTVTEIGDYAFSDEVKLESINIPTNLTTIGKYALSFCQKLPNITLPSSVSSIGESAFCGCSEFTSFSVPAGVETLPQYIFSSCTSLESVTIPSSVKTIDSYAFSGCSSLSTVVFERPSAEQNLTLNSRIFNNCPATAKVAYSGNGNFVLYNNGTEVAEDELCSNIDNTGWSAKTLNWVAPAPVLPQATVTDITNSEENTLGLDAAFKFEAPEGTTAYDDYYCDFKISFDRDLTSDDIELWGQYGNYPWTNLASEASGDAYTIEKDTDYYLLRDIVKAPMTYAQIREIGTFLCGIKSHYGAAGATINVQLVLFEEPEQGGEIAPITLDEKVFVAPTEPDNGASITVAETISENFYLDDEFYGETAYVSFTYNHNSNVSESADVQTDVQSMTSLDDATDGRKKFSVVQAPAQATEPITINIYANAADAQAGTNAIDTIDYSVYTYCRDIIENYDGEKADEMKALAKSTLDYAAAAQTYFGYNTDDMATKDAQGGFYNEVANADLSNVAGVSAAPSCIKKVSLVVKSDLEINLLSNEPIDVTGASIAASKGAERFAVETKQNGDYYVVHIAGIEPANMGKAITINTDKGDIVMTANSVVKMFANSTNANLSTLAKALFEYGNAANAYFG